MNIPFEYRHGIIESKPQNKDFPQTARIALIYLLEDMCNKNLIISSDNCSSWGYILNELARAGRIVYDSDTWRSIRDELEWLLNQVQWFKIFTFCERVHDRLITSSNSLQSLEEAKIYFTDELNQILFEENLDYKFENGIFERRGRLQTQKSINRMGSVLSDSNLVEVRKHYTKALRFFTQTPEPDYNNSIKEALCALELTIEICTGKNASNNFNQALLELQGNGNEKIPSPIIQSMIKMYAYRGSGKGVSHSAPNGNKVSDLEAELVLNLVASYITYIVDSFPITKDDVPF